MSKRKQPCQGFCLIHWLQDDQVGVMPEKSIKERQSVSVGSYVECKWGKKFYEAQVLMLSGEF